MDELWKNDSLIISRFKVSKYVLLYPCQNSASLFTRRKNISWSFCHAVHVSGCVLGVCLACLGHSLEIKLERLFRGVLELLLNTSEVLIFLALTPCLLLLEPQFGVNILQGHFNKSLDLAPK